MFVEWRLKIRDFFKKNKNTIIIVVIIWAAIIVINYFLGKRTTTESLNVTYQPHDVLLTSEFKVPEELQNPIEDLIDDYINKCNSKDYSGAYNLLTDDCKKYVFDDSLDNFTEYASSIFKSKKRYSIQDYSNYGKYYIYSVKIIDDIITTGLTGQEYAYYEEKMGISRNGEKLQLCVSDYMGHTDLKKSGEDDNIKIRVESRDEYYGFEIYTIRITNKTEKKIVLFDNIVKNELSLITGTDARDPIQTNGAIYLVPGETRTFEVTFAKYYDEEKKADTLGFNKIRIMNEYTGEEETEEEELAKAEKVYGINIAIQ